MRHRKGQMSSGRPGFCHRLPGRRLEPDNSDKNYKGKLYLKHRGKGSMCNCCSVRNRHDSRVINRQNLTAACFNLQKDSFQLPNNDDRMNKVGYEGQGWPVCSQVSAGMSKAGDDRLRCDYLNSCHYQSQCNFPQNNFGTDRCISPQSLNGRNSFASPGNFMQADFPPSTSYPPVYRASSTLSAGQCLESGSFTTSLNEKTARSDHLLAIPYENHNTRFPNLSKSTTRSVGMSEVDVSDRCLSRGGSLDCGVLNNGVSGSNDMFELVDASMVEPVQGCQAVESTCLRRHGQVDNFEGLTPETRRSSNMLRPPFWNKDLHQQSSDLHRPWVCPGIGCLHGRGEGVGLQQQISQSSGLTCDRPTTVMRDANQRYPGLISDSIDAPVYLSVNRFRPRLRDNRSIFDGQVCMYSNPDVGFENPIQSNNCVEMRMATANRTGEGNASRRSGKAVTINKTDCAETLSVDEAVFPDSTSDVKYAYLDTENATSERTDISDFRQRQLGEWLEDLASEEAGSIGTHEMSCMTWAGSMYNTTEGPGMGNMPMSRAEMGFKRDKILSLKNRINELSSQILTSKRSDEQEAQTGGMFPSQIEYPNGSGNASSTVSNPTDRKRKESVKKSKGCRKMKTVPRLRRSMTSVKFPRLAVLLKKCDCETLEKTGFVIVKSHENEEEKSSGKRDEEVKTGLEVVDKVDENVLGITDKEPENQMEAEVELRKCKLPKKLSSQKLNLKKRQRKPDRIVKITELLARQTVKKACRFFESRCRKPLWKKIYGKPLIKKKLDQDSVGVSSLNADDIVKDGEKVEKGLSGKHTETERRRPCAADVARPIVKDGDEKCIDALTREARAVQLPKPSVKEGIVLMGKCLDEDRLGTAAVERHCVKDMVVLSEEVTEIERREPTVGEVTNPSDKDVPLLDDLKLKNMLPETSLTGGTMMVSSEYAKRSSLKARVIRNAKETIVSCAYPDTVGERSNGRSGMCPLPSSTVGSLLNEDKGKYSMESECFVNVTNKFQSKKYSQNAKQSSIVDDLSQTGTLPIGTHFGSNMLGNGFSGTYQSPFVSFEQSCSIEKALEMHTKYWNAKKGLKDVGSRLKVDMSKFLPFYPSLIPLYKVEKYDLAPDGDNRMDEGIVKIFFPGCEEISRQKAESSQVYRSLPKMMQASVTSAEVKSGHDVSLTCPTQEQFKLFKSSLKQKETEDKDAMIRAVSEKIEKRIKHCKYRDQEFNSMNWDRHYGNINRKRPYETIHSNRQWETMSTDGYLEKIRRAPWPMDEEKSNLTVEQNIKHSFEGDLLGDQVMDIVKGTFDESDVDIPVTVDDVLIPLFEDPTVAEPDMWTKGDENNNQAIEEATETLGTENTVTSERNMFDAMMNGLLDDVQSANQRSSGCHSDLRSATETSAAEKISRSDVFGSPYRWHCPSTLEPDMDKCLQTQCSSVFKSERTEVKVRKSRPRFEKKFPIGMPRAKPKHTPPEKDLYETAKNFIGSLDLSHKRTCREKPQYACSEMQSSPKKAPLLKKKVSEPFAVEKELEMNTVLAVGNTAEAAVNATLGMANTTEAAIDARSAVENTAEAAMGNTAYTAINTSSVVENTTETAAMEDTTDSAISTVSAVRNTAVVALNTGSAMKSTSKSSINTSSAIEDTAEAAQNPSSAKENTAESEVTFGKPNVTEGSLSLCDNAHNAGMNKQEVGSDGKTSVSCKTNEKIKLLEKKSTVVKHSKYITQKKKSTCQSHDKKGKRKYVKKLKQNKAKASESKANVKKRTYKIKKKIKVEKETKFSSKKMKAILLKQQIIKKKSEELRQQLLNMKADERKKKMRQNDGVIASPAGAQKKQSTVKVESTEIMNKLKVYLCHVCKKPFDKDTKMRNHFSREHNNWCFKCQKRFNTEEERRQHLSRNHDVALFCGMCNRSYFHTKSYMCHLKSNTHKDNVSKLAGNCRSIQDNRNIETISIHSQSEPESSDRNNNLASPKFDSDCEILSAHIPKKNDKKVGTFPTKDKLRKILIANAGAVRSELSSLNAVQKINAGATETSGHGLDGLRSRSKIVQSNSEEYGTMIPVDHEFWHCKVCDTSVKNVAPHMKTNKHRKNRLKACLEPSGHQTQQSGSGHLEQQSGSNHHLQQSGSGRHHKQLSDSGHHHDQQSGSGSQEQQSGVVCSPIMLVRNLAAENGSFGSEVYNQRHPLVKSQDTSSLPGRSDSKLRNWLQQSGKPQDSCNLPGKSDSEVHDQQQPLVKSQGTSTLPGRFDSKVHYRLQPSGKPHNTRYIPERSDSEVYDQKGSSGKPQDKCYPSGRSGSEVHDRQRPSGKPEDTCFVSGRTDNEVPETQQPSGKPEDTCFVSGRSDNEVLETQQPPGKPQDTCFVSGRSDNEVPETQQPSGKPQDTCFVSGRSDNEVPETQQPPGKPQDTCFVSGRSDNEVPETQQPSGKPPDTCFVSGRSDNQVPETQQPSGKPQDTCYLPGRSDGEVHDTEQPPGKPQDTCFLSGRSDNEVHDTQQLSGKSQDTCYLPGRSDSKEIDKPRSADKPSDKCNLPGSLADDKPKEYNYTLDSPVCQGQTKVLKSVAQADSSIEASGDNIIVTIYPNDINGDPEEESMDNILVVQEEDGFFDDSDETDSCDEGVVVNEIAENDSDEVLIDTERSCAAFNNVLDDGVTGEEVIDNVEGLVIEDVRSLTEAEMGSP